MTFADLGPLESKVMNVLWDQGASSIRETINALGSALAYTTIATVFRNLEKKNLVTPCKDGRAVEYCPVKTREEYVAAQMQHSLASSKDKASSILHFVETMSDEDLELLRQCLDQEQS